MSNKAVHSDRLERWLGKERIEQLSHNMRGWYGPPISILDLPGGVRVHGDGDFSGPFERGVFMSAMDALDEKIRRTYRRFGRLHLSKPELVNAGYASISDALAEMTAGKRQWPGGMINKVGTAPGAAGGAVTMWYVGNMPAAGAAAAAAPTGTIPTDASTGGLLFTNPVGGDTSHLVGADMNSSVAAMSLLLYDRLFSVTKTMNSSATEAVTAATTRYNNTVAGAADSAEGNFLMIECRTVLPATAHNWTVCQYTDQGGTTAVSLPSVTGISSCAANRLDMATGWFCPLASGDTGIRALTQMQCSAAVATGAIDFTMGHPLGVMSFPLANFVYPFDWLTNRDLAPRIMDDACIALLQLPMSANTATTFTGQIVMGQG